MTIQELKRCYLEGATLRQLADLSGESYQAVRAAWHRLGIVRPPGGLRSQASPTVTAAQPLLDAGLSQGQVAKEVKVSRQRIGQLVEKGKLRVSVRVPRRIHPFAVRRQAKTLLSRGVPVAEVARRLQIHRRTLFGWKQNLVGQGLQEEDVQP